jgi:SH3 domain-containing YSC84-like protein 1
MFRLPHCAAVLCAAVLTLAAATPAVARSDAQTIRSSQDVLEQFLELKVKQIPESLLAEAHGVAIIPDVIKVGFVVGGQRGKGVAIIREPDGSWRAPLFITLTGGSIGWQAGAQSSDLVLVFKSQQSVQGLLRGKFTLGADAAVAAGPVGRRAEAATDIELKAEIYSYSRSRGLFAGISLDGSALQVDDEANAAYYGSIRSNGKAPPPPKAALKLVELVAAACTPAGAAPTSGPVPAIEAIPTPALSPAQPAGEADALRTELARSMASLSPLLDDNWRRYLALPAEVHQTGQHPSAAALQVTLKRFDSIAKDARYRTLADRGEFQSAYGLLQAYSNTLSADNRPQLALPPPPDGVNR